MSILVGFVSRGHNGATNWGFSLTLAHSQSWGCSIETAHNCFTCAHTLPQKRDFQGFFKRQGQITSALHNGLTIAREGQLWACCDQLSVDVLMQFVEPAL